MAVNYVVQAEVVDIRGDTPVAADRFLVDTNVWLWATYPKATAKLYQTTHYPPYLSKARRIGAKVHWCGLSQSELAHNVEGTEREQFERSNPGMKPAAYHKPTGWLTPKEFRHNYPGERANVVLQFETAWGQVTSMASCVDATIDDAAATAALKRFQSEPLDGYDLFMVEAATQAGIHQILSDDGDFCTVPGVCLFTANANVIAKAAAAGKLIVR